MSGLNASMLARYFPFPMAWALGSLPLFFLLHHYFPAYAVSIALVSSVLLGMPHGAADPLLAWQISRQSWLKSGIILAMYLGVAVLTWHLWVLLDPILLIVFLLVSILHFMLGGRSRSIFFKILLGGASVLLPLLWHPEASSRIFKQLSERESWLTNPESLSTVTAILCCVLIASAFFASRMKATNDNYKERRLSSADIIESALIFIAAYWLPPLLFFSWYFCTLHSPLHLREVIRSIKLSPVTVYASIFLTLIATAILGYIAYGSLQSANGTLSDENQLVRLVFQGLAALTFPHMLLVALWQVTSHRQAITESN